MTDTSRGTAKPASRAASSTPSAWTSEAATTAVGGSGMANSSAASWRAAVRTCGPYFTYRGSNVTPASARASGVAGLAVAAGHEAERVALRLADERDALVAQRQEVVGGDPAAGAVVDDDARQRRVRRVDQHGRERRLGEPVAFVGAQRERDDDQPVELVPWNFHQPSAGPIGGVDVVQHDLEAVRLQRPDDAAEALVRGRLVEVRDEHADEPLPPGPLPAGERVGL